MKNKVDEKIVDGVVITTYDDGSQSFNTIETKKDEPKKEENLGFFGKLKNWYDGLFIKPYVKIRDLADPFGDRTDADAGSDGKNAIEAGIRIDF